MHDAASHNPKATHHDQPHAVVAGYGLVGRAVAEQLVARGADVTIVDTNRQTILTQRKLGQRIIHGDIREPAVLKAADIEHARALVLTIPDADVALQACKIARSLRPDVFIAARTNFLSQGILATKLGADQVTVEEVVTAHAMQQAVIEHLEPQLSTRNQSTTES